MASASPASPEPPGADTNARPATEPPAEPPAEAPAGAPTEPGTLVRLDGTVLDRSRPALCADDLGVLRGDGVFEALLVTDGRPVLLREHLDRLARSAAALGLRPPEPSAWERCLAAAIARHGGGDAYARLVLTRGRESGGPATGYALVDPLPATTLRARADGIRVLTLTRGTVTLPPGRAPWLLHGAKSLSYAVNMAAQRWARAHDAEDVIFLAEDGMVLEGPTSAVLLARGDRLLSPPPELGILPSIALGALFAEAAERGRHCAYARLTAEDLHGGDGLWLVSSVRLAARVRALDGADLPPGPHHDAVAALLHAACRNPAADRPHRP
ncbi:aminodeoxychorismate lyase [Kitasatospora camelliae]|uniref:Aminodeoxychorismate lyase n=1 Tax=Kitasatospora camelliae TaxID=3156397 RepID=A0AAU8JQN0_9ACTN